MRISRRARPDTVTIYNYVSSTAGVATYQRTVLERVYLDRAYQQRLSQRGVATTDAAQMIMDLSDVTATAARTFIAPERWPGLTALEKAQHYTFQTANDFFVEGTATETLPADTKATMQGKYRCYPIASCTLPASSHAAPVIVEVTAK